MIWNLISDGVRVRFRVRFQAVKIPVFGGFPVENPTKKTNCLKALLSPDPPILAFLEKARVFFPKSKGFYLRGTPKILWKERKNAQKSKENRKTKKARKSKKARIGGSGRRISLSEYSLEGFEVRLRRLSGVRFCCLLSWKTDTGNMAEQYSDTVLWLAWPAKAGPKISSPNSETLPTLVALWQAMLGSAAAWALTLRLGTNDYLPSFQINCFRSLHVFSVDIREMLLSYLDKTIWPKSLQIN